MRINLETTDNKRVITACCFMFGIIWVVFGNSLLNGFVWDDITYIVNNDAYQKFDIYRIVTGLAHEIEFLPVRDISYAIDFAIWNGNPSGFHASNVLIYGITILAVFYYSRITYLLVQPENTLYSNKRAFIVGLVTALLFAVHPIHCEVVNFITCRNSLLSTLFFFVSCTLYLNSIISPQPGWKRTIKYGAALICFLLSIFSKANSVILPLILILELIYLQRTRSVKSILSSLPFFIISIISFFVLTSIASRANVIVERVTDWTFNGWITKIAKALQIIAFYTWKLIYPNGFSADYDVVFAWSPTAPSVIACLVGLVITVFVTFLYRRKYPYLLFSLCWYLLALIPVLNFFLTTPIVADRYAYLPSFAFFFVIAVSGVHICERIKPIWLTISCILLVSCWSWLSMSRNRIWFSEETLWKATILTSPGSFKGYRNLGNIYYMRGDFNKAIEYFAKISNDDPSYYHCLGFLAYKQRDFPSAIQYLNKSLGRNIQFIPSLFYLALIYEEIGQTDKASEYFLQVVQSQESDPGRLKLKAMEHLDGA